MPKPVTPKLTNRGPAGLLSKLTDQDRARIVKAEEVKKAEKKLAEAPKVEGKINNIPSIYKSLVVDISSLTPDPENARVHPEKNLQAIQDSLRLYGQMKPIAVRKANRVIMAGNGTVEAAKALGWTKIAAAMLDVSEIAAIGYGLADNRTAELARWENEVVARLDKILLEAGMETVGWSKDELEVMRAAEWVPPPVEEDEEGYGGMDQAVHTIKLTVSQQEAMDKVVKAMRDLQPKGETKHTLGECLRVLCVEWLEAAEIQEETSSNGQDENGELEESEPEEIEE